ncbi:MAG: polysaccharide deacetylase family protein [Candidatus Omnitrophota bacterium]
MLKKIVIKKAIADLMYGAASFLRAEPAKGGFRALCYHSITDGPVEDDHYQMTTPKGTFEAQMRYLYESGHSVMSCDEIVDKMENGIALPPKALSITFDDGFRDILTNAAPILMKYGFKSTVFLPVDFIGKSRQYLDLGEARELLRTGVFSAGSHSMSHANLHNIAPEDAAREAGSSRRILEDRLMTDIRLFAYPYGGYGAFNKTTMDILKAGGYKAAFTTIAGYNRPDRDLYALKRTRICWFDDEDNFMKELQGAYDWYEIWQKIIRTP